MMPVPTLGSAPETGFYFGAVSLFNMRLFADTLTRNSNAKVEFNYTAKRQIIGRLEWLITGAQNRWIWQGNNAFLRFPENIWQVGALAPSSSKELYQADRLEMLNGFYYRLRHKWYAGVVQRLQNMYHLKQTEGQLIKNGLLPGAAGGISSGVGMGIFFDSRFNLLNPEAGAAFYALRYLHFGRLVGSQYAFQSVELDVRRYFKGFATSHVIATQLFGYHTQGEVPFRLLGLMGGDGLMRGMYMGRYRDKTYAAAQVEYRWPVWRWLGLTTFAAAGQVAPSFTQLTVYSPKVAGGIGLRIRVDKQENTNMRFDFARSSAGTGFYVSFGEAF